MEVVWWGLKVKLGDEESGHSSNLKNIENEEFPEKVA